MNTGNKILTHDVVYDRTIDALEKEFIGLADAEKQDRWESSAAAFLVAHLPILDVPLDAPRDYAIRIFATPFGSKLKIYFSVRSNFVHFAYLSDEDGEFTITSNEIKQMVNEDYSESAQSVARKALHVVDHYAWISFCMELKVVIGGVHNFPDAPIEIDYTTTIEERGLPHWD